MEKMLTVKEAANALRVSVATIYNLHQHGELTFIKVGDTTRIAEGELERFIKAHTIQKTTPENKEEKA